MQGMSGTRPLYECQPPAGRIRDKGWLLPAGAGQNMFPNVARCTALAQSTALQLVGFDRSERQHPSRSDIGLSVAEGLALVGTCRR